MGVTEQEYLDTSSLTVQWDLEMHEVENQVKKILSEREG
jgi:hypothetical protein